MYLVRQIGLVQIIPSTLKIGDDSKKYNIHIFYLNWIACCLSFFRCVIMLGRAFFSLFYKVSQEEKDLNKREWKKVILFYASRFSVSALLENVREFI